MFLRLVPVLLIGLAPLGPHGRAGETPEYKDGCGFVFTTDVEVVLLDVSVRDVKGGFVAGLAKENFEVYENEQLQEIKVFATEDVPVSVGLVVDNSGSMWPKKEAVMTGAQKFVELSHPTDEIFVVNFNDKATLGLPKGVHFSSNPERLRSALSRAPAVGRTALYDAVELGLKQLEIGTRSKKILVVISDGGDNSSKSDFKDVLKLAQKARATVYTVGLFGPNDADRNPGVLKRLAKETGGEFYMPDDVDDVTGVAEQIANDIRMRYNIGYAPKTSGEGFRPVKVKASAPGHASLDVHTRNGYIAAGNKSKPGAECATK